MASMTFSRVSLPAAIALAVSAFSPSAQAVEPGKESWLGSVGGFLLDGLGPARTMEDIRREEERARNAPRPPVGEPSVEAAKPQPAETVKPVVAAPAAAPAPLPAPDLMPVPEIMPVTAPMPAPAPTPAVRAAAPAVPPHPVAVPEARPKPPAVVRAPEPPAAALPANRIAATASLDQALKLGGTADIYGGKPKPKVSSAVP